VVIGVRLRPSVALAEEGSPYPLIVSSFLCNKKRRTHQDLMYSVYILKSLKDKRTYVGCTHDLKNRIKEHNSGEVKSTKARIPFILWYKEDFDNKLEAFNREKHLKTSWGRRQLRKILEKLPK